MASCAKRIVGKFAGRIRKKKSSPCNNFQVIFFCKKKILFEAFKDNHPEILFQVNLPGQIIMLQTAEFCFFFLCFAKIFTGIDFAISL